MSNLNQVIKYTLVNFIIIISTLSVDAQMAAILFPQDSTVTQKIALTTEQTVVNHKIEPKTTIVIDTVINPISISPEINIVNADIEKDKNIEEQKIIIPGFDKINLDGSSAFRNKETGQILTQRDYNQFMSELDSTFVIAAEDQIAEDDYWSQSSVNPYKDVEVPSPFVLLFDQNTFTPPIDKKMVITSRFGRRRRGPHRGLDIDLVTGDFVRTVLPGKVRFVGYSRGHGKTVVIRHANNVETLYAHLSGYSVKVGMVIEEGAIIGLGGNTGNSRGSHLHLEVRYMGVCVHPEYVFNLDGSNTIRGRELWVSNTWKNPRSHNSYRQSKIEPLCTEHHAIAYEANAPKYYKIRKGDTLSAIARKHNLYLREICSMNSIARSSTLAIGRLLRIR
ncbi:MAG: M23 family metallopeptidase [Saprospiraceae bacterium]